MGTGKGFLYGLIVQLVRILVSKTRDTGSSPVQPTKELFMNKQNKYNQIKEMLSNKGLVNSLSPSMGKITEKIKSSKKLRLVYGETYDKYGLTIDSLKYYFFVSLLHRYLESIGIEVQSYVIVGDIHSVKNKIVQDKQSLLADADERMKKLEEIKKVYHLSFEPILMSKAYQNAEYKERLKIVNKIFNESKEFRGMAEKTVLVNRLSQENRAGFQYTVEEVALIMDYDIKIGPLREIHYDKIARLIGKQLGKPSLCGIYLQPTYPLGMNFNYFICNPEIEKYGLTPYKAGSNRLQENRVVIGRSMLAEIETLIDESFISNNPELPNPVLDLYSIAEMAKVLLENGELNLEKESLVNNPEQLKEKVLEYLKLYIYEPLKL